MRGWRLGAVTMACLLVAGPALAAELRAEIKQTTPTGTGESLGTVTLSDGAGGAAVKTALKGLPPGPHGFHVHQNGSCQSGGVGWSTSSWVATCRYVRPKRRSSRIAWMSRYRATSQWFVRS